MTKELREKMSKVAVEIGSLINYKCAGTVEFIYDENTKNFYFLEVNTRLQVEHPVTEFITGLDLVKLQIDICNGKNIKNFDKNIQIKGHAIEVRLCAEDPNNNFFPQPGEVVYWKEPIMEGLRFDAGVETGR
jgi:acetyl/propionyl-CoA carboxylase alpha subunit